MNEDPSRHFDAPRTGSIVGAVISTLRDHWQTAVALLVNVSILQSIAFGLVGVDVVGSDRVAMSVASVSIFVAAEPEATAAEVDALGPLIRAVPGISNATLRAKDDAIKSLIASGLPPPDGRNPLPDVWIVHLQAEAGGSVTTAWTEKKQALAALPRVASVSTDERWISTIDRGVSHWRTRWPAALWIALGTLALATMCAAYLAGSGMTTSSRKDGVETANVGVLAFVGCLVGCGSALIGYTAAWTVGRSVTGELLGSLTQLMDARPLFVGSIAAVVMLILAGGCAAGRIASGDTKPSFEIK